MKEYNEEEIQQLWKRQLWLFPVNAIPKLVASRNEWSSQFVCELAVQQVDKGRIFGTYFSGPDGPDSFISLNILWRIGQ